MLIRQGADRTLSVDRRLAWSLAAIAGALNTVAFREVGFFSANMTGNVSLLSSQIAAADWANSLLFLLILTMFIAGATCSTLLIIAGQRRGQHGVYAYSILAEGILLALLGGVELWLPTAHRAVDLILGLSFLMGLQNAVVTQISHARVRTTHVSGMATDIGIELGLMVSSGAPNAAPTTPAWGQICSCTPKRCSPSWPAAWSAFWSIASSATSFC